MRRAGRGHGAGMALQGEVADHQADLALVPAHDLVHHALRAAAEGALVVRELDHGDRGPGGTEGRRALGDGHLRPRRLQRHPHLRLLPELLGEGLAPRVQVLLAHRARDVRGHLLPGLSLEALLVLLVDRVHPGAIGCRHPVVHLGLEQRLAREVADRRLLLHQPVRDHLLQGLVERLVLLLPPERGAAAARV